MGDLYAHPEGGGGRANQVQVVRADSRVNARAACREDEGVFAELNEEQKRLGSTAREMISVVEGGEEVGEVGGDPGTAVTVVFVLDSYSASTGINAGRLNGNSGPLVQELYEGRDTMMWAPCGNYGILWGWQTFFQVPYQSSFSSSSSSSHSPYDFDLSECVCCVSECMCCLSEWVCCVSECVCVCVSERVALGLSSAVGGTLAFGLSSAAGSEGVRERE